MDRERIEKELSTLDGEYTFYYSDQENHPIAVSNRDESHRFLTASVIKVPLLFAWYVSEKEGFVSSDEICDPTSEPIVKGAGFYYLFHQKALPYHDLLLMMIATSDNYCTNLIINKLGFERINHTFSETFHFRDTHLGRKMMSKPDSARGYDNWTTTADMIHCYDLFQSFPAEAKKNISEFLSVCQADKLFTRNLKGDSVDFYHKSGGLHNVINEWGFTDRCQIFLLCNNYSDYQKVYDVFGNLGKWLLDS